MYENWTWMNVACKPHPLCCALIPSNIIFYMWSITKHPTLHDCSITNIRVGAVTLSTSLCPYVSASLSEMSCAHQIPKYITFNTTDVKSSNSSICSPNISINHVFVVNCTSGDQSTRNYSSATKKTQTTHKIHIWIFLYEFLRVKSCIYLSIKHCG